MSKFKVVFVGKPKYSFDPKTLTTKCLIKYDIKNFGRFVKEGPQTIGGVNPIIRTNLKNNKHLWEFAESVKTTIAMSLVDKHILKVGADELLYVEATAKFNQEDPKEEFSKEKGRRIAFAKAQMEILKVEASILYEMEQLACRLLDCVNWMGNGMPNNVDARIKRQNENLQTIIDGDTNK